LPSSSYRELGEVLGEGVPSDFSGRALEVAQGAFKNGRVVFEVPEAEITAVAERAADLAGDMVVIYNKVRILAFANLAGVKPSQFCLELLDGHFLRGFCHGVVSITWAWATSPRPGRLTIDGARGAIHAGGWVLVEVESEQVYFGAVGCGG